MGPPFGKVLLPLSSSSHLVVVHGREAVPPLWGPPSLGPWPLSLPLPLSLLAGADRGVAWLRRQSNKENVNGDNYYVRTCVWKWMDASYQSRHATPLLRGGGGNTRAGGEKKGIHVTDQQTICVLENGSSRVRKKRKGTSPPPPLPPYGVRSHDAAAGPQYGRLHSAVPCRTQQYFTVGKHNVTSIPRPRLGHPKYCLLYRGSTNQGKCTKVY